MDVVHNLLRRMTGAKPQGGHVPGGMRVYAIGDIHGRVDLLEDLHAKIRDDAGSAPAGTRMTAVYLGDYVDRGLHSRQVIDLLLDQPLPGFTNVYLKGNHEAAFLRFLEDPASGPAWFSFGGNATVFSYGVRPDPQAAARSQYPAIRDALCGALPDRHLTFLKQLRLTYELGGYLFAHAGIHPGRSMADQCEEDLLWIRDEFLNSRADFGRIVVHGHTIAKRPVMRRNRIGIDTGAYASGVLTALALEGRLYRLLST